MLPKFNEDGDLPPGLHSATWQEVRATFGWNQRRSDLLDGLEAALKVLKQAGCKWAYLNGSFVTAKEEPGDFDVCWEPDGVDYDKLDPVLLDFSNKRSAQKAKYGGELFPATADATGDGTPFIEFFQSARGGGRKGIVAINLKEDFP
ncbi:MAG: hypothetical protein N2318_03095 [Meiothermus sp.]|nr:hypothetical protein [Meiothermus sp.]